MPGQHEAPHATLLRGACCLQWFKAQDVSGLPYPKGADLNMLLDHNPRSAGRMRSCLSPGAAELNEYEKTLEALGLDNRAMLVMRWAAT